MVPIQLRAIVPLAAALFASAPQLRSEEGRATSASGAVEAWLGGDPAEAARGLAPLTDPTSRHNRAVALLYGGDASAAERELLQLESLRPGWTPAVRWLARARAASGSAELASTISRLLQARDADSRDFLWAGRLSLRAGDAAQAAARLRAAVAREADLYLGWLWLGDAEQGLGRHAEARKAWREAQKLHAGGEVLARLGASPEAPPAIALALEPGETLRYTARYLFFRFAKLEIVHEGWSELHGRRVARIRFSVRSNPGFPLLKIDSRFESLIADDGSVLSHRSSSRDSTQQRRMAVYEMNPDSGECRVRQVVDGLFGFDTLPLAPLSQDGLSILQLARGVARGAARGHEALSVLTAVDSTWKGTAIQSKGNRRLDWAGCERDVVQVELVGQYRGPGGLSGRVNAFISHDARAIPYRAEIKLLLGSAVLELDPGSGAEEQTATCPSPSPARS